MGTLSDSNLNWQAIPFEDWARAERTLAQLQGTGAESELFARFAGFLYKLLRDASDPDRLLLSFARWLEAVGTRLTYYRLFAEAPRLLAPVLKLMETSHSLTETLLQSPELSEILLDPNLLNRKRTRTDLQQELNRLLKPCSSFWMRLDRLRLFKNQEMVRITALDAMGKFSLPEVARALSDLADVCIQGALECCDTELRSQYPMEGSLPLVVLAMGKLGGRELNYSSDIDLIFLCADSPDFKGAREPLAYLTRLCEMLVKALTEPMRRGILFRVDLRLRPEGRFGPLVRTLSSAWHYYENWAETWERQATIKARPCAGDFRLGEQFLERLQAWIYRHQLDQADLKAVAEQKLKVEAQTQARGEWESHIKNGWGGIRDIEFSVQALQLLYGGRHPRVRVPNTLEALRRLRSARIVAPEEEHALREAYCFLRTVEHRLQMLYGHQTHTLPKESQERTRLAKRLGFDSLEAFEEALQRHRQVARQFREGVLTVETQPPEQGGIDIETLLLLGTPEGESRWLRLLQAYGFREPSSVYRVLVSSAVGTQYGESPPEVRRAFLQVLPHLLTACSRTPDPSRALHALEGFADTLPNRASLYQAFAESPEVLTRLAELAQSPVLWNRLMAHPELMDMLFGEEIVAPYAKTRAEHEQALQARLSACKSERARLANLRAYARREQLRIGARDLWGETRPTQTTEDLTALAETLLLSLLPEGVGLLLYGSFGASELGYASDWDVGFVIPDGDDVEKRTAQLQQMLQVCQQMHEVGAFAKVDTRLRPEGGAGALVRTVEGYADYFARSAEPWERLATTRLRLANPDLPFASQFLEVVDAFRYGNPPTPAELEAMHHLIQRALTERVRPDQQERHLKLGKGGLAVIEFLTQIALVQNATLADVPFPTDTLGMLEWLHRRGVLARTDYEALHQAWLFFYHLRNRLALLFEPAPEVLPAGERLEQVAISLGYPSASTLEEEFHEHWHTVSRIQKFV